MKKILFFISLSFILCNLTMAQSFSELERVKEIKLLQSNRDDVRRIFAGYEMGKEKRDSFLEDPWGYFDLFYTDNVEIKISYSDGKCNESDYSVFGSEFDVSEWTVVRIKISLNQPTKIQSSAIDLSKYKKELIYKNAPNLYAYYNKESGIVYRVYNREIQEINFIPTPQYNSLMCNKVRSKILSSNKSIFAESLKHRKIIDHQRFPGTSVSNLNLSQSEIFLTCEKFKSAENKKCANQVEVITVLTVIKDHYFYYGYFGKYGENQFSYNYMVSGGKIIGSGPKVEWDLSGVEPGIYTIQAAVDDGCGFCGRTKTKKVVVKDCPDCQKK